MISIDDISITPEDILNKKYHYQPELTKILDSFEGNFDQALINEIVLWKVNRYAAVDEESLSLLNLIKKEDTELNVKLTESILSRLLTKDQKGVRLAMASTILRFKNPNIYQIIDQRVFRFIYKQELKLSETHIDKQIKLYLDYLHDLKDKCREFNVNFKMADRIFYSMDKLHNPDEKINW